MNRILFLYFLCSCAFLGAFKADPTAKSFVEKPRKFRLDTYDFSGLYPDLECIDIQARKKKNVEVDLSGEYPVLEKIYYEGTFGVLDGELTGHFPKLKEVCFAMTSALMHLDLRAKWEQSCKITIIGDKRDITLELPEDVGVCVTVNKGLESKVSAPNLKKNGWLPFTAKSYENELYSTAEVCLDIQVNVSEGNVILN